MNGSRTDVPASALTLPRIAREGIRSDCRALPARRLRSTAQSTKGALGLFTLLWSLGGGRVGAIS
jgi:hypothetical protein